MKLPKNLILGTRNLHKVAEISAATSHLPITFESLADYPHAIEVDETGTSFEENATLKAVEQAKHLDRWVLAEDSGISVAALGGRPGIYSARFAGVGAGDAANLDKLLAEMEGKTDRAAFYTSVFCLSDPEGNVRLMTRGECHGVLTLQRRGEGGFGYDPIFLLLEYRKTFGQLGNDAKEMISHRGRSVRKLVHELTLMSCSLDAATS